MIARENFFSRTHESARVTTLPLVGVLTVVRTKFPSLMRGVAELRIGQVLPALIGAKAFCMAAREGPFSGA
jgi:hypothetical protein